jgi:hypothetical protein
MLQVLPGFDIAEDLETPSQNLPAIYLLHLLWIWYSDSKHPALFQQNAHTIAAVLPVCFSGNLLQVCYNPSEGAELTIVIAVSLHEQKGIANESNPCMQIPFTFFEIYSNLTLQGNIKYAITNHSIDFDV